MKLKGDRTEPEGGRDDDTERGKVIYTLGTSTRSMDDFLAVLRSRGIVQVADVRSFPSSRRYPQFSRESLATPLAQAGLAYAWFGKELGGYRKGGYPAHMQTPEFKAGMTRLERWAAQGPTAIICAELLPSKCHRRFIARLLEERGWRVVHAIDGGRDWTPSQGGETGTLF